MSTGGRHPLLTLIGAMASKVGRIAEFFSLRELGLMWLSCLTVDCVTLQTVNIDIVVNIMTREGRYLLETGERPG